MNIMWHKSSRHTWCLALLMLLPGISFGHSPHHVITDVAVTNGEDESEGDVFIIVTDQLFRSSDDGAVWKNLISGLTNRYSFTSIAVSPGYKSDGTALVASEGDGVYVSRNRGDTWETINAGLDRLDIGALSVSPDYEADGRVLAASVSGGVWRRTSEAENWQMVLTEQVRIRSFAEQRGSSGTSVVYAGDSSGRIWRSSDNGRLWEIIHELAGVGDITSIAATEGTIWIGTSADGLYQSIDEGLSFSLVETLRPIRREDCRGNELEAPVPDRHITSVVASPDGKLVLVTTWFDAVFVSENNGGSWVNWAFGLSCEQQADDMSVPHFRKISVAAGVDGQPVHWLGTFDGLFRATKQAGDWRQLETLPLGQIKGMAVTGGDTNPLVIALAT
jgi:hypothetical protein